MRTILAILVLASCASATTITGCNTGSAPAISAPGSYDLGGANIVSDNVHTCVEVTGANTGTVTINCGGFYFDSTDTATTRPVMLYIHDNTSEVDVTNCRFRYQNLTVPLFAMQTSNAKVVSEGNWFINSGDIYSTCGSDKPAHVHNGEYQNALLNLNSCNGSYAGYNHLWGYAAGYTPGSAITIVSSDSVDVEHNSIEGLHAYSGTSPYSGLDDGIIFIGDSADVTGPSPSQSAVHTAGNIHDNVVSYVFDMCIEFTGAWTYTTVTANACSHAGVGGVGGWYNASFDHLTLTNNIMTSADGEWPVRFYNAFHSLAATRYFTNNTITGNVYDNSSPGTVQGQIGENGFASFGSFTGNTVANNQFGTNIYFQSGTGIIDGGGNRCGTTYPSGVVACNALVTVPKPGGFIP